MKRLLRNIFVLTRRQKKIIVLVFLLSIYRNLLLLLGSKQAFSENLSQNSKCKNSITDDKKLIAKDIALAITIVNQYVIWKNVCRHQSWQAIYILNKFHIPFQFYVGVKKNLKATEGHSWVKVNDKFICGRCNEKDYLILNH